MERTEIMKALHSISDGKVDVINDRLVMFERGYYLLEGYHNRKFAWNIAVEVLSKPYRPKKAKA